MARTAEPTITVVLDPDDDIAALEQLRRLHARPYGQILCEPDPTATSIELARYLLEALGKRSEAGTRRELWTQVGCHLRAEHVHDLAVARAHTLTYSALRDLADHAHDSGTAVWLLLATERMPAAVTQLLEARPHQTRSLEDLINRWHTTEPPPDPDVSPHGVGRDYPYLTPIKWTGPLSRAKLCAKLTMRERGIVATTWSTTQTWMTAWLDAHPDCTGGQLATAIQTATAPGDTASELLIRACAAIDAVHGDRIPISRDQIQGDIRLHMRETRPYEWRLTVERAAGLIDTIADPEVAAMLALSIVYRRPSNIRRIRLAGVAPDGSITYSDHGGLRAIPLPLRPARANQRQQLLRAGGGSGDPLLPGIAHDRMSERSIEDVLLELDIPRTAGESPDEDYFDNPELDGRAILYNLDPITLFSPAAKTGDRP